MARIGSLRKCMRVKPSGWGRTAKWLAKHPDMKGTVLSVKGANVYIHWDGTSFSDELMFGELKRIPGRGC